LHHVIENGLENEYEVTWFGDGFESGLIWMIIIAIYTKFANIDSMCMIWFLFYKCCYKLFFWETFFLIPNVEGWICKKCKFWYNIFCFANCWFFFWI
jgi:hypothetical protein